jgi:hypothetical protein
VVFSVVFELLSIFFDVFDFRRPIDIRRESIVTLLLQCCYTITTVSLHCCYTITTLLLHSCYTITTLLLHCCYTVVGTGEC